jgi:hypothetical protein
MAMKSTNPTPALSAREQVSLCEALDRVLNKGVVVVGEITISVADIELIYLGLQVILTSIETARGFEAVASPAGVWAKTFVGGKEAGDGR